MLSFVFAALMMLTVIFAPLSTPASQVTTSVYPSRPQGAYDLSVAIGTFEGYRLHREPGIVFSTITIRDPRTGEDRSFYLADRPTLNGELLAVNRQFQIQVHCIWNTAPISTRGLFLGRQLSDYCSGVSRI